MRILKIFGGDFGETAPDLGLPWFPPSPPTRALWLFAIIATLQVLHAAPTNSPPKCPVCTHTYDANFDDLPTLPLALPANLNPPPMPYKALAYTNVRVASSPLAGGLKYHSPPNAGIAQETSPVPLDDPLGVPTVTLDALYPNTKVQTFKLKSFWFGCKVRTEQGNGGPATGCAVQVTGYKQDPKNPSVCQIAGVSPLWPFPFLFQSYSSFKPHHTPALEFDLAKHIMLALADLSPF